MHKKLTFDDIDYILSHQKLQKLPDRRWLHVWNSYDIQNFRGFNADAEEYEKNRNASVKRTVEIREAAGSDRPTANVEFLAQREQAARAMEGVLQQQQNFFDKVLLQMRTGMRDDI